MMTDRGRRIAVGVAALFLVVAIIYYVFYGSERAMKIREMRTEIGAQVNQYISVGMSYSLLMDKEGCEVTEKLAGSRRKYRDLGRRLTDQLLEFQSYVGSDDADLIRWQEDVSSSIRRVESAAAPCSTHD